MGNNNDSAYGGLFIIGLVIFVLLVVCGGGAGFVIFGYRMNSTVVGPVATTTSKVTQSGNSFINKDAINNLAEDNSLSEDFITQINMTDEQHEHFKTVITKYQKEINEIADPKTAYSLIENDTLKIEIDSFQAVGIELEQDLREELKEKLTSDQIKELQKEINLFEPFLTFGQYKTIIEFGPSESSDNRFRYNRECTGPNNSFGTLKDSKIENYPFWKTYENKRQELLKKKETE